MILLLHICIYYIGGEKDVYKAKKRGQKKRKKRKTEVFHDFRCINIRTIVKGL